MGGGGSSEIYLGLDVSSPCSYQQELDGYTNCAKRVYDCGEEFSDSYTVLDGSSDETCSAYRDRMDPYQSSEYFIVEFTSPDKGVCKEALVRSGECWGYQPETGSDYGCQGRCGGGCAGNICSNWAASCFVHDVCSYYYGSSGGSDDEDCGWYFDNAEDDWWTYCAFIGRDTCELSEDQISGSSMEYICGSAFTDDYSSTTAIIIYVATGLVLCLIIGCCGRRHKKMKRANTNDDSSLSMTDL